MADITIPAASSNPYFPVAATTISPTCLIFDSCIGASLPNPLDHVGRSVKRTRSVSIRCEGFAPLVGVSSAERMAAKGPSARGIVRVRRTRGGYTAAYVHLVRMERNFVICDTR